jgi:hypothetical protein
VLWGEIRTILLCKFRRDASARPSYGMVCAIAGSPVARADPPRLRRAMLQHQRIDRDSLHYACTLVPEVGGRARGGYNARERQGKIPKLLDRCAFCTWILAAVWARCCKACSAFESSLKCAEETVPQVYMWHSPLKSSTRWSVYPVPHHSVCISASQRSSGILHMSCSPPNQARTDHTGCR